MLPFRYLNIQVLNACIGSTPTPARERCSQRTPLLVAPHFFKPFPLKKTSIKHVALPRLPSSSTMRCFDLAMVLLGSVMVCGAAAFLPPFAGGAMDR